MISASRPKNTAESRSVNASSPGKGDRSESQPPTTGNASSSSVRCCQTIIPIITTTVMPARGNDSRRRISKPHGRAPGFLVRLPVATPSKVTNRNNST